MAKQNQALTYRPVAVCTGELDPDLLRAVLARLQLCKNAVGPARLIARPDEKFDAVWKDRRIPPFEHVVPESQHGGDPYITQFYCDSVRGGDVLFWVDLDRLPKQGGALDLFLEGFEPSDVFGRPWGSVKKVVCYEGGAPSEVNEWLKVDATSNGKTDLFGSALPFGFVRRDTLTMIRHLGDQRETAHRDANKGRWQHTNRMPFVDFVARTPADKRPPLLDLASVVAMAYFSNLHVKARVPSPE